MPAIYDASATALTALHDRAFDRGLITFDTELRLVCSKALKDHFAHATVVRTSKPTKANH